MRSTLQPPAARRILPSMRCFRCWPFALVFSLLALPSFGHAQGSPQQTATQNGSALSKGPWSLRGADGSVWIVFEMPEEDPNIWVTALGDGLATTETPMFRPTIEAHSGAYVYRAKIDAPEPGLHNYGVRNTDGETLASGTFTVIPDDADEVSFWVYGDDRSQHRVHQAVIANMLEDDGPTFVLHTGDYVEVGGRPSDWQTFFRIAGPLLRRSTLYPCLGNHELYGPGGRHAFHRYLAPDHHNAWYRKRIGPLELIVLDSNDAFDPESEQRQWLEAQVADGFDDDAFQVVLLHHSPLSSGRHGGQREMIFERIPELLQGAGVDLIFAGHDHMYERGEANGLKYIIAGGGGAPLYRVNRAMPYQQAFEAAYHHLEVDIAGGRMNIVVHRLEGAPIERCSFAPGEPWQCSTERIEAPAPDENAAAAAPGNGTEGFGSEGPIGPSEAPPEDTLSTVLGVLALGVLGLVMLGVWRRQRATSA